MAEEIKARGESARWQSDCKPYRTHAVNVISESMNQEEGKKGAYLNINFPNQVSVDCDEIFVI